MPAKSRWTTVATHYDQDFFTWTQEQADALRARRFETLDLAHLADEIEDMGRSEQRALASRLAIIVAHLLKLQVQTERTPTNEKSWRNSVATQRRQVQRYLRKNPGLKKPTILIEVLESAWDDGRDLAIRETGLDPDRFPVKPAYSLDQLIDDGYWPSRDQG
nr:DUF29 domain-containing protein [Thiococcus pfennigii]